MSPAAALKVCMTCGVGYPADALFCPKDGTPLTSFKGVGGNAPATEEHPNGAPPEDPYLGRELLGHIEIRQLAGAGAMGRVYRAFQKGIDRDVAVKILHRELSANQQLVARFHREAKVASRLQHSNVVQVHLAGQLPDGALYIVMEYLDGLSLQSALAAAGGSMPLVRALRIALQICDATGEAHAQGIVHRDLKPENVMLVRRGEDSDSVKVLDFGVARLEWGEQSMATAAGLIFGTARYISPEGAQGEAVGPAGDVYAIATLVYQMLSGRTPFDAEQAVALLVQQIHDVPPPMTSHARASYVPAPIADAVMKNLAKESTARDPDARAFGRALLEAATRSGLVEAELVGRSSLVGARPEGAMQLASLQRTAGLAGSPANEGDRVSGLPNGQAASAANAAHAKASPAETQRWTPVDAPRITPTPPPRPSSSPSFPAPTRSSSPSHPSAPPPAPSSSPKTLDDTLDDEPLLARDVAHATHMRTEIGTPLPTEVARAERRGEPTAHVPHEPNPAANREHDDHDAGEPSRAIHSRTWAIALLCFVGGVAIFGAIAFRLKLLGPSSKDGTLDDQLAHARTALQLKHWDAPPGDNVRDLTSEGLSKWPRDPRLLEIRAKATDDIDLDAVRHELAGDANEALRLARLARELDPSDTTAQHLVDKYEAALASPPVSSLGSLAPINGPDASVSKNTSSARVTFDVTPAHARTGQPVAFLAHVSGRKRVDDAQFGLLVDGQPTTLLAEATGPGTYRAAFTFLVPGKYDVTFAGKVDGATIHATRTVSAANPGGAGLPENAGNGGASTTPAGTPGGTDPNGSPADPSAAPGPAPTAGSNPGPTLAPSTTPTAAPSGSVRWL